MLKDEFKVPHRLLQALLLFFMATMLMGSDCAHRQPTIEDGNELEGALRSFHKNLRWARYEDASRLVADEYKQVFLGRYEELGEDFHITMLEVVSVKMQPLEKGDKWPVADVEVEQEWYIEPNMTVKKDTFVETWNRRQTSWVLEERVTKKEWRELQKKEKEEAAAKAAAEKETAEKEAAKEE